MVENDFLNLIACDNTQRMKHRENSRLEFKANFNKAALALYAKTIVAFANNQGGSIIFGIKDKPRKAIGMGNNNFDDLDNKDLSHFLNEHFSPEIEFNICSFTKENKKFGLIEVLESSNKPIICIKNGGSKQELIEAEIYYRYNARTQRIKYSELKKILDSNLELERQKWMEHIQNIAKIGPKNVKMLDLLRGEIDTSNGKKIVIDKDLLKDIKFVNEGKFVEKDGAPALKLIGKIKSGELIATNLNLNEDFYTTKELLNELKLNIHHNYFRGIRAEYPELKDKKYCQEKKNQKYYSKFCLEFLKAKKLTVETVKELCQKHKLFKKNTK